MRLVPRGLPSQPNAKYFRGPAAAAAWAARQYRVYEGQSVLVPANSLADGRPFKPVVFIFGAPLVVLERSFRLPSDWVVTPVETVG